MNHFDLPLEIVREIIKQAVVRTGGTDNRPEFFAREVIKASCSTIKREENRCYVAHEPYYLQRKALARDSEEDNFWVRGVRDTSYRMVEYYLNLDPTRDAHETLKQTSLAISRAAINLMDPAELGLVMPQSTFSRYRRIWDIDVNIGSDVFRKPLFSATYNDHPEIAQFLLSREAKADDNKLEYFVWDEEELRDWEKRSVWPSGEQVQFPRPNTARGCGVRGHEQVVRFQLFQSECKVLRSSHSYFQAIIYAAIGGNVELLKLMCKEADISPIPKIMAPTLWNHALLCAAFHERDEIIRFWLENMGAQVNYAETYDAYGMKTSVLGLATMRGYNSTVRLLLDKGAEVNGGPNSDPEVPIFFAAYDYGFPSIVALLLDEGASMPPALQQSRVLLWAVNYNYPTDVMRVFLEKGVHKRYEDGGQKALQAAVDKGRQDVVALFQDHGVILDGE